MLVPLPEEADVVVDEAAVRAGARLDFGAQNGDGKLTRRELSVLRLVAHGLGNKEIASELGISTHTVKYHLASLLAKLGVHSRTEAVTIGFARGSCRCSPFSRLLPWAATASASPPIPTCSPPGAVPAT